VHFWAEFSRHTRIFVPLCGLNGRHSPLELFFEALTSASPTLCVDLRLTIGGEHIAALHKNKMTLAFTNKIVAENVKTVPNANHQRRIITIVDVKVPPDFFVV
jgi:hypothetical protein